MSDPLGTEDVIVMLRLEASKLQLDLDKWPVSHRDDQYGGFKSLSGDVALWTAAADKLQRFNDLATEFSRYFTSGNGVPVDRVSVSRQSDLFLLLQEVLPEWKSTP